jgi:hypothetical protein
MNNKRLDVPLLEPNKQKQKDCKKTTPDFKEGNPKKGIEQIGFKSGNIVSVDCVSLLNKAKLKGIYKFDSYDSYDNTCFICKSSGLTFNVLLSDLKLEDEKNKFKL